MDTGSTRRTFLRDLVAGAALLPAVPAALAAREGGGAGGPGAALSGLPPRGAPADEAYWRQVRGQFAFSEDRVPMNAANLCPSPRVVADRVTELTRDIDVDCSFQNRAKLGGMLEEARTLMAAHLGVDADEVALVRNTSEANNTINAGLELGEGDEVVVWDQNHPTNNVAWDVRAARYGIRVRRVSVPTRPGSAQELVDPFVEALSDRTRVLTVSHVSNVSGIRLPVRAIADAAHARGVHVHVDGAQSLGAHALDLRAMGCDSYASSTHKWLMGPKEAGVLWVRAEANIRAGRHADALVHLRHLVEVVEARVHELADALKEGVTELGIPLVTPRDRGLSGGVVILEVAGDGRAVFDRLYREHGIAGAPTGGLRLSPHVYNTMEHVERVLGAVEAMLSHPCFP